MNTFRKIKYLIQELTLIMKFILLNEIDCNLIDLLDLLLKLLTKSKEIIEYRKTILSIDTIKIVPILFSKLEYVNLNSYKILHFNNVSEPKDLILSMIIDIFKYLYSYDTLEVEENNEQDSFKKISKKTINNIKIISFNISIEKNLALNLSIINHLLHFDFNELTYRSLFDFCAVSVDSKNNLDETLFEILFRRMPYFKEEIGKAFLEDLTINCKKNEYFISRICDLSYFIQHFNEFLTSIHEKSINYLNYIQLFNIFLYN